MRLHERSRVDGTPACQALPPDALGNASGRIATTPRRLTRQDDTALLLAGVEPCLMRPTGAGRARQLERVTSDRPKAKGPRPKENPDK